MSARSCSKRSRPIPDSASPSTSSGLLVSAPALGLESPFPLDPATQQRFLEGLDDIGISLRYVDDIAGYEASRPAWLPSTVADQATAGR